MEPPSSASSTPTAWEPCDGGTYTPAVDLTEGPHGLLVRATNGALADPTPAVSLITVDLTAPGRGDRRQPGRAQQRPDPGLRVQLDRPDGHLRVLDRRGRLRQPVTSARAERGPRRRHAQLPRPRGRPGHQRRYARPSYDWEARRDRCRRSRSAALRRKCANGPGEGKQTNAKRPIWYFERTDINLDDSHGALPDRRAAVARDLPHAVPAVQQPERRGAHAPDRGR